jgi:myo-inositol 2-dehydrogenase/D-chiro-inositol 1-dehydrogenase
VVTRVGFVGAGWVARVHARVMADFGDVELVGVTSRTPEAAARLAATTGARTYPDYRAMLDEAGLDAIFVCVPPDSHDGVEEAAIDRGVALFVEKPLGVDEAGPARIAARLEEAGLVSCVGYQWRYLEVVERARELLDRNPAQLVLGWWLGETPGARWWTHSAESGGQIVEQATHIWDLARFMVGELEPVSAIGVRVPRAGHPDSDIQDVTSAAVRFASGAIGSVATTSLLPAAHRVGLEAICDGVALTLEVLDHRLTIWRGSESTILRPPTSFETPYAAQNRAFIDAVQGKPNRIRSPYEDALRTHRATMAATRLASR